MLSDGPFGTAVIPGIASLLPFNAFGRFSAFRHIGTALRIADDLGNAPFGPFGADASGIQSGRAGTQQRGGAQLIVRFKAFERRALTCTALCGKHFFYIPIRLFLLRTAAHRFDRGCFDRFGGCFGRLSFGSAVVSSVAAAVGISLAPALITISRGGSMVTAASEFTVIAAFVVPAVTAAAFALLCALGLKVGNHYLLRRLFGQAHLSRLCADAKDALGFGLNDLY